MHFMEVIILKLCWDFLAKRMNIILATFYWILCNLVPCIISHSEKRALSTFYK